MRAVAHRGLVLHGVNTLCRDACTYILTCHVSKTEKKTTHQRSIQRVRVGRCIGADIDCLAFVLVVTQLRTMFDVITQSLLNGLRRRRIIVEYVTHCSDFCGQELESMSAVPSCGSPVHDMLCHRYKDHLVRM